MATLADAERRMLDRPDRVTRTRELPARFRSATCGAGVPVRGLHGLGRGGAVRGCRPRRQRARDQCGSARGEHEPPAHRPGSSRVVARGSGLPSRGRPRPRPRIIGGAGGRGLHVVDAVAYRWGVTDHPDGKTVWALSACLPADDRLSRPSSRDARSTAIYAVLWPAAGGRPLAIGESSVCRQSSSPSGPPWNGDELLSALAEWDRAPASPRSAATARAVVHAWARSSSRRPAVSLPCWNTSWRRGAVDILLDLHDVTFIDCGGVSVLVDATHSAAERGVRLRIVPWPGAPPALGDPRVGRRARPGGKVALNSGS